MKKRLLILIMLLIALPMVFFSGCSKEAEELAATAINEVSKTVQEETSSEDEEETKENKVSPEDEEDASEEEAEIPEETISEYGEYSDPYEVAEYLYTYHHLPSNYITKDEAEDLGWNSSKGNLWDVAEGMSIGGDRFGNYEKQLPKGNYHECDVNYEGGFRGSERLIYSDEFEIYYTQDHYESFIQLY